MKIIMPAKKKASKSGWIISRIARAIRPRPSISRGNHSEVPNVEPKPRVNELVESGPMILPSLEIIELVKILNIVKHPYHRIH